MVLPKPDVVGDQQVDAGHLKGSDDRVELVVLDRDARAEGRLQRAAVSGGDRAPSHGVEEGIETPRIVKPVDARMRQRCRLQDAVPRVRSPRGPQLVTQGVLVNRCELNKMLRRLAGKR